MLPSAEIPRQIHDCCFWSTLYNADTSYILRKLNVTKISILLILLIFIRLPGL